MTVTSKPQGAIGVAFIRTCDSCGELMPKRLKSHENLGSGENGYYKYPGEGFSLVVFVWNSKDGAGDLCQKCIEQAIVKIAQGLNG